MKGWDDYNNQVIFIWMDQLEEKRVVLEFFGQSLKELESRWGWRIIILSSFVSFIALIELDIIPFFASLQWELFKKILLSFCSILTTLIAAWIKKGNYIDRIKNIDRRVLEIEKVSYELKYQTELQPKLRDDFMDIKKKYQEQINHLRTFSRLISQKERYKTLYKITKYYPDLVRYTSPWWKKNEYSWDKNKSVPNYDYGNAIIINYERNKYKNGYSSKFLNCFWCKSKCCMKEKYRYSKNPFDNKQYAEKLGYKRKKRRSITNV